jgi:transposase
VPRAFDKELYKARHLIENFYCKLKQYRAIATRYDKTASTMAGYDLIRLPKLIAATAQTCRSNIQPFGRPLNDTTHTTSGGF